MEGTEEGDDTDELFVRPVVRIAAPAPVLAERGPSSAEIGGKRQRSQVRIDRHGHHLSPRTSPLYLPIYAGQVLRSGNRYAYVSMTLCVVFPGFGAAGSTSSVERTGRPEFHVTNRLAQRNSCKRK